MPSDKASRANRRPRRTREIPAGWNRKPPPRVPKRKHSGPALDARGLALNIAELLSESLSASEEGIWDGEDNPFEHFSFLEDPLNPLPRWFPRRDPISGRLTSHFESSRLFRHCLLDCAAELDLNANGSLGAEAGLDALQSLHAVCQADDIGSVMLEMQPSAEVVRSEMIKASSQLSGVLADYAPRTEALLHCRDDNLVLRVMGADTVVATPKAPCWYGHARFSARLLGKLDDSLPPSETVKIWVESGELHIGTITTPCTWHWAETIPISMPIDPGLTDLLATCLRREWQDIESSGLGPQFLQALSDKSALLGAAFVHLKQLGVGYPALAALVDESILKKGRQY